MKILVFGKDGQLGKALQKQFRHSGNIVFSGRLECDLTDQEALDVYLNSQKADLIINTAAFTAVDLAENSRDLAYATNSLAPQRMANYCAQNKKQLIHFSTDYVFDGLKEEPYCESDLCYPLNIYGKSKLDGELKIKQAFYEQISEGGLDEINGAYIILRSTWIYGDGSNFIKSILRAANERETLNVVSDQYGVPVSTIWLSNLTQAIIESNIIFSGIYHAVPKGKTSWFELAQFILECCKELNITTKLQSRNLHPILTKEYPSIALRPQSSVLSTRKLEIAYPVTKKYLEQDWKIGVKKYIQQFGVSQEVKC